MYNIVAGTVRDKETTEVKMFLPGFPDRRTGAITVYDWDRLPAFSHKGQIIAVNPYKFNKWANNHNLGFRDIATDDRLLNIATNPALYTPMRIGPVGSEYRLTPIDYLNAEDQHKILLHEVSTLIPAPYLPSLYLGVNLVTNMATSSFIQSRSGV